MVTKSRRKLFEHLDTVINEYVIDVLGAFIPWNDPSAANKILTDPTTLAYEIARAVSINVIRTLAADPNWPNSSTAFDPNELTLTKQDVKSILNVNWYMAAAGQAQIDLERTTFPGWDYQWIFERVKSSPAVFFPHGTPTVAPAGGRKVRDELDHIILRRDGSYLIVYIDGRKEHSLEEQKSPSCATQRTRYGKPKSRAFPFPDLTPEELANDRWKIERIFNAEDLRDETT